MAPPPRSTSTSLPESLRAPIDVLMIDNFDSFTWNLYQSLSLLGANVTVIRNDAIPVSALSQLRIKHLIISPGPGHPQTDSGISRDAIRYFTGKVPVLGVCMGLECLVDVFGGEIGYAGEIKHGKLSRIRHDGRGIFNGLPQGFQSTRYHSLSASVKTLPDSIAITAVTEESGVIMGVRHRKYTLEAVQYHPESVLSESGDDLIKNFLSLRGGMWEENPAARVLDLALPPFPIDVPSSVSPSASNKLPTILEKIHTQRLKDIELAKNTPGTTPADLDTLLSLNLAPPLIPVVERLRTTPRTTPALMAEIKRASPSKGPIAVTVNAAHQALTYGLAGASVISVLTEPTWFKGSLLDMRLARQAVDALPNRPAILRKDFIVDEYQIKEARLHGADTVLLIVAMLPAHRLKALYAYAQNLGMEPLVEVNNAAEIEHALALGAKLIGVNNRNLHSFEVDMGTTSRLAELVKEKDVILCALSGIATHADVRTYVEQGVKAVLVGEALMRAVDPGVFIRDLLGWKSAEEAEDEDEEDEPPLVKICGIRTVEEALTASAAGADFLGLMFVPTSRRYVGLDAARQIAGAIRQLRSTDDVAAQLHAEHNDTDALVRNEPWFAGQARRLAAVAPRPLIAGIFQNQPLAHVLRVTAAVGLDLVQLHGDEPLGWAQHIPVPVIRVFHVGHDGQGVKEIARPGLHKFVLLDAQRADGLSGGSGKSVDWELARRVVDEGEVPLAPHKAGTAAPTTNGMNGSAQSQPNADAAPSPKHLRHLPIILAGGLTPANVASAIAAVRPWAVDVSGGVELDDGSGKDPERVAEFVREAKGIVPPSPSESPEPEPIPNVQAENRAVEDVDVDDADGGDAPGTGAGGFPGGHADE